MTKPAILGIIVLMVVVIVAVDVAFFKNNTTARFLVNVGIVLIAFAFYLRFFK